MSVHPSNTDPSLPPPIPAVVLGTEPAKTKLPVCDWSYEQAFARNLGLISPDEQQRLRNSRIAIIGMGGVGGVHLVTLARLGVGAFHIADPDTFDVVNFNRQYGAETATLGCNKAQVMAEKARAINPELNVTVFPGRVDEQNVDAFLDGVDLLVDGVDFFSIETRRLVFCAARQRGIWAVTAGPIGFSTAWLVFDPSGMAFDEYFDFDDSKDRVDQLVAFAVGLTPRATHLRYLDLSKVNPQAATGPSASLACHLASGVAAAEALKILLGRGRVRAVPCYFQFDAYRQVLRKGRLRWGGRHPWQRFKRWIVKKHFEGRGQVAGTAR